MLKVQLGSRDGFGRDLLQVVTTLHVELVCLAVGDVFDGRNGGRQFQTTGNARRQLGLDREQIRFLTFLRVRPHHGPIRCALQMRDDLNPVARALHAALQDVGDVEQPAHFANIHRFPLELKGRRASDHAQCFDTGQGIRDFIGQTVGEILIGCVRGQVCEWQDRNGRRGLPPRKASPYDDCPNNAQDAGRREEPDSVL